MAAGVKNATVRVIDGETNQFGAIAGIFPVDHNAEIADDDTIFESCANPMLRWGENVRIT